jgi:hypothetical protein
LVVVDGRDPVLCGYVYSAPDGLEVRVEKGVRGTEAVFTAIEVRGAVDAVLVTPSFDSRRDLRAGQSGLDHVRFEADLENIDAGGMLFVDLGVGGGRLRVARRGSNDSDPAALLWTERALPAPLPHDITAIYLNCAGDLIRP